MCPDLPCAVVFVSTIVTVCPAVHPVSWQSTVSLFVERLVLMCRNTVCHTETPYTKRIFCLFRQRKELVCLSTFPMHPVAESKETTFQWPTLLGFSEFGAWHASAEVSANFFLTPLKQSAWTKAPSRKALQTCKLTIPLK